MHYDQTSPLDARYHEREVDISDSTDERMSSDRIHLLRPRATHRSAFKNPSASDRPSVTRRTPRGFVRFFFAVLIGVAATLGWQSYGDEAKAIVRAWDPESTPQCAKLGHWRRFSANNVSPCVDI